MCVGICGVIWRVSIFEALKWGSFISVSLSYVRVLFYELFYVIIFLFGVCLCFCLFVFLFAFFSLLLFSYAIFKCFQVHHVVKPSGRDSSGPPSFRSFSSLPDMTLAGTPSSATTKYSAIYARWKRWARDHDLPTVPASLYDFALYLRHLADASSIDFAVHGIAWVHHLAEERSPLENPLVKDVLACWCTASFSPPYFQEGTYCRCSIGPIS